eukprot:767858-Hanusia_phi.AAC.1
MLSAPNDRRHCEHIGDRSVLSGIAAWVGWGGERFTHRGKAGVGGQRSKEGVHRGWVRKGTRRGLERRGVE